FVALGDAAVIPGLGVARIQPDGVVVIGDRRFQITLGLDRDAAIEINAGVARRQFDRLVEIPYRRVSLSESEPRQAAVLVNGGGAWNVNDHIAVIHGDAFEVFVRATSIIIPRAVLLPLAEICVERMIEFLDRAGQVALLETI